MASPDKKMSKHVDALIVGAGPTGLALGLGLLAQGKRVLIAEKHPQGLDFSRAILVNADTLGALAPFGVSQALREAGVAVDGFTLHANGRVISQARYVVDPQDMTHPVCLPQLHTEKILSDRFLQAGGEIIRGYAFMPDQAQIGEGSFTCVLSGYHDQSSDLTVHGQWLFGCDGFHSAVRQRLGVAFPGSAMSVKPYAVDLDLTHWPFDTNVNVFMDREGGCLAVQIGPNQLRLVTTTLAQKEAFLRDLPVTRVTWDSTFDIHFHVADSYGRDHVWLAGDAVHVHSPVGGRGMNMGILDAVALAQSVQSGDLADYAAQRHQAAKRWVQMNRRVSVIALDQAASSRRVRRFLTLALPVIGKVMGSRLAHTAFSRLSASRLTLVP